MRIIGGKYKGQRLTAPQGRNTRPTTDQTRESIFNILSHGMDIDFLGMTVLDLYSGSGGLGFEAFSRGAKKIIFMDKATPAIKCIKNNKKQFREHDSFFIYQGDASFLPARSHGDELIDLVFVDPPYRKNLVTPTLISLSEGDWLKIGAVVVAEMGKTDHYDLATHFSLISERKYGDTKVAFISYNLLNLA